MRLTSLFTSIASLLCGAVVVATANESADPNMACWLAALMVWCGALLLWCVVADMMPRRP